MRMLLVLALTWCAITVFADVSLSHVFGDHMVLQQGRALPVWGWSEPGERVTVTISGTSKTATANRDGKWRVTLPAMKPGEPREMTVKGNNTIVLKDILVGEVWICSGQSNMEFGLGGEETSATAVPGATNPQIRLLKVNAPPSPQAELDIKDTWNVCSPQTVPGFSAVGYFFGKKVAEETDVPVGLIEAAWGGTRIEPWTPAVGFKLVPELDDVFKHLEAEHLKYREELPSKLKEVESWIANAKNALKMNQPLPNAPEWPRHPLYSGGHPSEPTVLYNSRIHPLVPFAIRGAIWYQGEANVGDQDNRYYEKSKALIEGWRRVWNQGDFPFYFVQIAPGGFYPAGMLPLLWEQQVETLDIPNTGMAVVHDIGNLKDIHPRNKRDVGARLALWALAKDYGKEGLVYSGPLYDSMKVEGDKAIVSFYHAGSGLTTRDGKAPNWFEITGEDKQFVKAAAEIKGDTVVVSSPDVKKPAAVRFAWDPMAEPNLMNKEGLPASPFRTDRW